MQGHVLAALPLLAACFDPAYNNPRCGPQGECPSGLTCVGGTCRAPTPLDGMTDTPRLDAAPDGNGVDAMITVTFQDGVGGYAMTLDTWLDSGQPNQGRSGDSVVRWRFDTRWALLRFDGIFSPTVIPPGATILSANLTLNITGTAATGELHDAAVMWVQTDTYNTFGGSAGVAANEVGPLVATMPTVTGPQTIDVTASLARWSAAPATHFGWIIVATIGGGGSESDASSSDNGTIANRPRLSVTYAP